VVESWLPDYALEAAVAEFKRGGYRYVVTCGRTLGEEWLKARFKTGAEFAAANLAALGLATNVIVAVPPPPVSRDRTYASALALKDWLQRDDARSIRAVNLFSLGPHSRRSWLLFRKALGRRVKVGVVSCADHGYDSRRWWASSNGVSATVNEAIAYLYARLLFRAG
jgi:hypothetical protein